MAREMCETDDADSTNSNMGNLVADHRWSAIVGGPIQGLNSSKARIAASTSRWIEHNALDQSIPMILRGYGSTCCGGCPGWSDLRAMCAMNPEAEVIVSRGVEERNKPTNKVEAPVPLLAFLDGVIRQSMVDAGVSKHPKTSDSTQVEDGILYAKQFDILGLLPQLQNRLPILSPPLMPGVGQAAALWSHCMVASGLDSKDTQRRFATAPTLFGQWRCVHTVCGWVAQASAVTGAHTDDEHNVLLVLAGSKVVTLVHPDDAVLCAPNGKYDSGTVCFDADIETPDFIKYPGLRHARRQTVWLGPGDALVLPHGWVHQVRSPEASVSVNVFASTPLEAITHGLVRGLAQWLHGIGIYRWGHCVCHSCHSATSSGDEGGEGGEGDGERGEHEGVRFDRSTLDRPTGAPSVRIASGGLLALVGAGLGVGLAAACALWLSRSMMGSGLTHAPLQASIHRSAL